MIETKKDLIEYLDADKYALKKSRLFPAINDLIWKYEIALRKSEYYQNTKHQGLKIIKLIGGGTGSIGNGSLD